MAQAPLSADDALEIYRRAWAGEPQTSIADKFGISQTAVSKIKHGRNWGWLTGRAA